MGKPVSVFICGVQKAGTTTLYEYLRRHPGMSHSGKELHFFDDETANWDAPDYARLEGRYSADDGERLRFEATPIYAYWAPVMARLRAYNPEAKLIFLFRDPFDRAWSQWRMEYQKGFETLPFRDALRHERERMNELPPLDERRRVFSYVERGLYAQQLRRVLAHFPKQQILLMRSADLWSHHMEALGKVTAFLGVKPFSAIHPIHEFKGREDGLPSLRTQEDLDFVAQEVAADILEFSDMTGMNVSDWPVVRNWSNAAIAGKPVTFRKY